jgi:hypothetical protein
MTPLIYLIGLGLLVLWATLLWNLGQGRRKNDKLKFFLLLFIPLVLSVCTTYYQGYIGLPMVTLINLLILALIILFYGFWGTTLYEVVGNDKLVWFILILIVSPLWILYKLVEWR